MSLQQLYKNNFAKKDKKMLTMVLKDTTIETKLLSNGA